MTIKNIVFLIFLLMSSYGCSLGLGMSEGKCESEGCDYSDAGICGDVYEQFKRRRTLSNEAYKNIDCSCSNKLRGR